MSPGEMLEALDVVTAVDLGDYALFQQRKRLVASVCMDEATIVAKVRSLDVLRLAFDGRFFDLEIQGVEPVPAAVIFALDQDEFPRDLVAWPLAEPTRLATLHGFVPMLGQWQLDDCSPWDEPLPVHRTAIAWLRAGCRGVVPIDAWRAARAFLECEGALQAEDAMHAAELAAARAELVDRAPPIVLEQRREAA